MSVTGKQAMRVFDRADRLYSQQQVEEAIQCMASEITEHMAEKNPLVLCVMTGGLISTGQLLLHLNFPLQLDYVHATRYGNLTQGNELEWVAKPKHSLKDRVVLVIDDILDEGLTLASILAYCRNSQAKEVYSAVLINKSHERKQGVTNADFIGLSVPDRYVFGYGMDYKGYLRNAKGIYAAQKNDE